jgi:RNA polymerase sigma factor (sigma-70 family)
MELSELARPLVAPTSGPLLQCHGTAKAAAALEPCVESVYRFVTMVARSEQDSADLAQEALARALRSFERYDSSKGPLDAWLWKIVINVARDAGRASIRRHRLAEKLGRPGPGDVTTVEDEALRGLTDAALLAAVRGLPVRARTLVALRFGAHLSYPQIAAQMGLTSQAAVMATRRAVEHLRRELSEGGR